MGKEGGKGRRKEGGIVQGSASSSVLVVYCTVSIGMRTPYSAVPTILTLHGLLDCGSDMA